MDFFDTYIQGGTWNSLVSKIYFTFCITRRGEINTVLMYTIAKLLNTSTDILSNCFTQRIPVYHQDKAEYIKKIVLHTCNSHLIIVIKTFQLDVTT